MNYGCVVRIKSVSYGCHYRFDIGLNLTAVVDLPRLTR